MVAENNQASNPDVQSLNTHNVVEENLQKHHQPADFVELVQSHIQTVKTDVKQRVDSVIENFPVKTDELVSIKETLKAEVIHLYSDLAQTAQKFKDEFVALSLKHKSHIVEELHKAKDNTVDAFSKINSSKIDKE